MLSLPDTPTGQRRGPLDGSSRVSSGCGVCGAVHQIPMALKVLILLLTFAFSYSCWHSLIA